MEVGYLGSNTASTLVSPNVTVTNEVNPVPAIVMDAPPPVDPTFREMPVMLTEAGGGCGLD
jgi:hypothetical protein